MVKELIKDRKKSMATRHFARKFYARMETKENLRLKKS